MFEYLRKLSIISLILVIVTVSICYINMDFNSSIIISPTTLSTNHTDIINNITLLEPPLPTVTSIQIKSISIEFWSHYLTPSRGNWAPIRNFIYWMRNNKPHVMVKFTKCPSLPDCYKNGTSLPDIVIVVALGNRGKPRHSDVQFIPWVQNTLKRKAIWFLLADEWCEWIGGGLYNAELSFKTYYHQSLLKEHRNVKYFPIGVSHKFPLYVNKTVPLSSRKYVFNFMGSTATSMQRVVLKEVVEKMNSSWKGPLPIFQHYTSFWSGGYDTSAGYMSPNDFQDVLCSSIFTLAPYGHAVETFRLWESLECSSIPIMLYSKSDPKCGDSFAPFRVRLPNVKDISKWPPFIFLHNWNELPNIINTLLLDMDVLQQKQDDLISWYKEFKNYWYGTAFDEILRIGLQRS
eukprot:NODE_2882_length_1468_cov_43.521190_g2440_i1.p1 GENE.NODE_2882_length_1468_cov_43.521190_g2440_i1~~NODE_2882_length_1468_cov_43.521190_g2440_i1.p1  ORF type:complete len:404 (+),score=53.93 NODE_2882_length_1468_cov_43.521190_g2440_i1:124-1335(+)